MRTISREAVVSGRGGQGEKRLVTLANIFTFIRVLALPVFVWFMLVEQQYGGAVVILALIGISDWADGFAARRLNQISSLGRILDPLADRLTFVVVALTLSSSGIAPWWLFVVVMAPDMLLLVISLMLFRSHPDLPVSLLGKLRTAAFLVGCPLFLLGRALFSEWVTMIGWVVTAIGILGHWVAAQHYLRAMVAKHRQSKVLRSVDFARQDSPAAPRRAWTSIQ